MNWEWTPHLIEGYIKLSGTNDVPVVHTYDLIVQYKDGTEKKETILDGYRNKKNARRAAQKTADARENGSESDEIENVTYKLRNVYINDWL